MQKGKNLSWLAFGKKKSTKQKRTRISRLETLAKREMLAADIGETSSAEGQFSIQAPELTIGTLPTSDLVLTGEHGELGSIAELQSDPLAESAVVVANDTQLAAGLVEPTSIDAAIATSDEEAAASLASELDEQFMAVQFDYENLDQGVKN